MSRTTRKRPYGIVERGGDATRWIYGPGPYYTNRDYSGISEMHDGCRHSPGGFNTHGTVANGRVSRAKAKRHCAHINRQLAKEAIRSTDFGAD